jgi:hypothetical protein
VIEGRAQIFSVGISIRSYYSSSFLWASQHQAAIAARIEDGHEGRSVFDVEHRALVLTSVLSAVSFLEAAINELFQDAADGHDAYLTPLSPDVRRRMAEFWTCTDEGAKLRPLDKYQMLLVLADKQRLDRGAQPFQNAALVVKLRNTLAHYLPEDRSPDIQHKLEQQLRGKFADNRLMTGSGNAWWPDHCLGHGCADWAWRSAMSFTDRVAAELGILPHYQALAQQGGFGREPGS